VSTILRAYKTELDLNNAQITACRKHAGAARCAYNWGLARKQEAYESTGTSPSAMDLQRELNTLKQTKTPWMYEISKCAPQEALRYLDTAFAHFYRRSRLKRQGTLKGGVGHPQRKSKKRGLGSFRLTGSIAVHSDAIQLPRLGRLRLKKHAYLPTDVHIRSATVGERGGCWYVSVLVEQEHVAPMNHGSAVEVDLGVKTLATLSDGTVEPNLHHLRSCLKRFKRCQRAVSRSLAQSPAIWRKRNGSRKKGVQRLARLHRHIAHQPANTLHQLTSRLAKTKSVVVIEDLNVSGMLKNHVVAQAIGDAGFGEFRRQLTYKAAWYGCRVIVANRWEATSKTCSDCGWGDDALTLADRVFCHQNPPWRLVMDRDRNAAINLAKLAGNSSERQNACGAGGAGQSHEAQVKPSSTKQEPNTFSASAETVSFGGRRAMMPNKTIYVADADLPLYDKAQTLAGGNLSAAIASALKRYVSEAGDESGEIVVTVTEDGAQTKKRFRGQLIVEQRVRTPDGAQAVLYRVYRTEKGRYAAWSKTAPNWNGTQWQEWTARSSWEEWWRAESRLDVYATLEDLQGNIPDALYAKVQRWAQTGSVIEDLDI
jgi:putative transposase